MIIKFKMFEKLNELPKIGDFILVDVNNYSSSSNIWTDFIKSHIGEIIEIYSTPGSISINYKIKFEDIPSEIKSIYFGTKNYSIFRIDDFKYWTSDINELEVILNSEKYNI